MPLYKDNTIYVQEHQILQKQLLILSLNKIALSGRREGKCTFELGLGFLEFWEEIEHHCFGMLDISVSHFASVYLHSKIHAKTPLGEKSNLGLEFGFLKFQEEIQ